MVTQERSFCPINAPKKKSLPSHSSRELASQTPRKQPTGAAKRTRNRQSGKRKVKSCSACRGAHIRCVADCYGVPCERCAKKSLPNCSLLHPPNDTQRQSEGTGKIVAKKLTLTTEPLALREQRLQKMAAAVEAFLAA
ncbi:Uu.00g115640.m01.CDS01 [Anthostomella pinea]|uniref:Uu.00g115640.m01.CDS01 n=1 Tax=Anthostomella pinea TaxID=933095 RepID=A0AAI8YGN6_9PEZI|nr:Uu.00g115640.m01.CDS01 [Anthostomella pinea]